MLTPEQMQQIQEAYGRAVDTANTPTETYLDIAENKKIVQDFMLSESLDQSRWSSEFIWGASIAECRKRGLLWKRKSPEQLAAERDQALRADGSRTANAHSHYQPRAKATADEAAKAKQWYADLKDPVAVSRRRAQEKETAQKAAEQEQRDLLAALPLDVDYQQMSKEQKAQFKRLNSDSVKYWLKRRAQWLANNPSVEGG